MKRTRRKSPYGEVTPAERAKLWRQENPEYTKEMYRRVNLKRKYGISLEQFDILLEKQEHRCAVCLKHSSEHKTKFHVDHNHKTGEIRGLLCNFCNRRVVGRHTNPDIFERAAAYLRQGTGWIVPPKKKRKKRGKIRIRATRRSDNARV